jgi:hypothetical protein
MQRVVREWVDKAEADYGTAGREFRARRSPNYDDACYPGMSANKALAREALAFCKMIRAKAREALKLRG